MSYFRPMACAEKRLAFDFSSHRIGDVSAFLVNAVAPILEVALFCRPKSFNDGGDSAGSCTLD